MICTYILVYLYSCLLSTQLFLQIIVKKKALLKKVTHYVCQVGSSFIQSLFYPKSGQSILTNLSDVLRDGVMKHGQPVQFGMAC